MSFFSSALVAVLPLLALPVSTAPTRALNARAAANALTPNGIKAGSGGGNLVKFADSSLGWFYDWSPQPAVNYPDTASSSIIAVPMLWGNGHLGSTENDATHLQQFKDITDTPAYILGYEEPDCTGTGSADIPTASDAAPTWDELIAPWGEKGVPLGSPSMCKQSDEDWLTPFNASISRSWDFTAIHINVDTMDAVNKDIDYYSTTYNKPIWVTEFACITASSPWTPCTDQAQINTFIKNIVDLFEADERVMAYGYSDGEGLGTVWPPVADGALTESGKTYLDAIASYKPASSPSSSTTSSYSVATATPKTSTAPVATSVETVSSTKAPASKTEAATSTISTAKASTYAEATVAATTRAEPLPTSTTQEATSNPAATQESESLTATNAPAATSNSASPGVSEAPPTTDAPVATPSTASTRIAKAPQTTDAPMPNFCASEGYHYDHSTFSRMPASYLRHGLPHMTRD